MVTPGTRSVLLAVAAVILGLSIPQPVHAADPKPATSPSVAHRTVKIDGLDIFYREAGPKDAPVVLLLHGFPSSSHMFRNLIPALAGEFHVVAPDYPGFGHSDAPAAASVGGPFAYTFDRLAGVIDAGGGRDVDSPGYRQGDRQLAGRYLGAGRRWPLDTGDRAPLHRMDPDDSGRVTWRAVLVRHAEPDYCHPGRRQSPRRGAKAAAAGPEAARTRGRVGSKATHLMRPET